MAAIAVNERVTRVLARREPVVHEPHEASVEEFGATSEEPLGLQRGDPVHAWSQPASVRPERGVREGAFDYISKPFNINEVKAVVKRALEKKQLIKENQNLK